ncbi:MAG: glycosyltransferase family 2 protein [Anaerolineae bacterium]
MTESLASAEPIVSTAETVDLAVVIVSWNVREHLDRCLKSLRQALPAGSRTAETWVVDNASSDQSVALVAERYPQVHVWPLAENLGYVKANNLALRALRDRARYIWLLNPDTVVDAGAVQALLDFLEAHPQVGLVGPKLLNPDRTLQESAFRFPGLSQALFALGLLPDRLYYTRLNGRYPRHLYDEQAPFPIDHPLGAAMMVRAKAVRDVGLLDEGFFMYCEEIDWAWRLRKAGWETYLVPRAEIVHVGGASSRQVRPEATAYLWESRARLYRKHQDALTAAVVGWAVRQVFARRRRDAETSAWAEAYDRILCAWKAPRARRGLRHGAESAGACDDRGV